MLASSTGCSLIGQTCHQRLSLLGGWVLTRCVLKPHWFTQCNQLTRGGQSGDLLTVVVKEVVLVNTQMYVAFTHSLELVTFYNWTCQNDYNRYRKMVGWTYHFLRIAS